MKPKALYHALKVEAELNPEIEKDDLKQSAYDFLEKTTKNKYLKKIIIETYSTIGTESTFRKSLENKFRKMLPERELLAVAFQSKEYDGLYQFTHRLILDFHKNFIEKQEKRPLDAEEKHLLDMYCEASVYMTMKWATKEMEATPQQMSRLLVDAMPLKLQKVYKTVGQTE